jgi:hypothetical protein
MESGIIVSGDNSSISKVSSFMSSSVRRICLKRDIGVEERRVITGGREVARLVDGLD